MKKLVILSAIIISVIFCVIKTPFGETLVDSLDKLFDESTIIPREAIITKDNENIDYISGFNL